MLKTFKLQRLIGVLQSRFSLRKTDRSLGFTPQIFLKFDFSAFRVYKHFAHPRLMDYHRQRIASFPNSLIRLFTNHLFIIRLQRADGYFSRYQTSHQITNQPSMHLKRPGCHLLYPRPSAKPVPTASATGRRRYQFSTASRVSSLAYSDT